jgi:ribosomal protein S18 acetylase RimI-like enzyme
LKNKPVIKEIRAYPMSELFKLVSDVYTTSDGMSETLEDKYPNMESLEKDMEDLLSRPGAIALIADIDNEPLGYLIIKPREQTKLRHTADLNMGVHHKARSRGLGKLMLEEALRRAQASPEIEILYLMVRTDNVPAINLYKDFGFETLTVLEYDTKIGYSYYNGLLMRKFVKNIRR